jgi:hypothetical protein
MFTLEALKAYHGDALLLHYGADNNPKRILIDGGPGDTFQTSVEPRLQELKGPSGSVDLEMVMVSHMDDDHIRGIVDLFNAMQDCQIRCSIRKFWHNSFPDLLPAAQPAQLNFHQRGSHPATADMEEHKWAVLASISQARKLRNQARALSMTVNEPFGDLVSVGDGRQQTVDIGGGLQFHILGPEQTEIAALRKKWEEDVARQQSEDAAKAAVANIVDRAVFNLSSIIVLAEFEGKRILLTGDARGDHVVRGLRRQGFLSGNAIEVDVLKVPHHGSSRNVDLEFFQVVQARHYVFSGDGKNDNPEKQTIDYIIEASNHQPRTLHFTFRLECLDRHIRGNAPWLQVEYPPSGKLGVSVEL